MRETPISFIRKLIETEHKQKDTLLMGFVPIIFFKSCTYYSNIQTWLDLLCATNTPDEYQPYIFMICAQIAINRNKSPCIYFFNAATVFLVTDACRAAQLYYQAAAYAETNESQQRYLRDALFAFKKVATHPRDFYITKEICDKAQRGVNTHNRRKSA